VKLITLILSACLIFSIGCGAKKTMYYWGDYSSSLYVYTKEPSDKSRKKHKVELQEIIQKSAQKNLKVPPGIHFELQ